MNKKTEDLIANLAEDAKQDVYFCTVKCGMKWIVAALIYTLSISWLIGWRMDFEEFISNPLHQIELALATLTGISAAFAAAWLSIPDCKGRKWMYVAPFVPLVALIGAVTYDFVKNGDMLMPITMFSLNDILKLLALVIVPAFLLIILLRRAASTKVIWTSIMVSLAIGGFAYSSFCIICAYRHPLELLINIILPVTVVCALLMIASLKWLKW